MLPYVILKLLETTKAKQKIMIERKVPFIPRQKFYLTTTQMLHYFVASLVAAWFALKGQPR